MGNQCYTIQLIEHHTHSQTPCAILNSPALPWLETKSCKQDVSGMVLVCEGKLLECMIDQLPSFLELTYPQNTFPLFRQDCPQKVLRLLEGSLPLLDLRMAAREAIMVQMIYSSEADEDTRQNWVENCRSPLEDDPYLKGRPHGKYCRFSLSVFYLLCSSCGTVIIQSPVLSPKTYVYLPAEWRKQKKSKLCHVFLGLAIPKHQGLPNLATVGT